MTSILIIDDEQTFLHSVVRMLRMKGYANLTPVSDPTEIPKLLQSKTFDAVLLDITMPGMDGLELLRIIKEHSPQTECIMVTANENIPSVIKAVKLGAYDYLVKPITPDQLTYSLERALEHKQMIYMLMRQQETAFSASLDNPEAFAEVITCDERMLRLLRETELHAQTDIPVLIVGATGTGKELLAQAIHKASRRVSGPFVAVNMLSLSATLFESEFFGHVKGAFTGAVQTKTGYLGQAQKGTLFLDEIGDLPMDIQGKLLRILQEGEYMPVGKTQPKKADVRFIAATNQDLETLVEEGKFRRDLYYRLRFAFIRLPSLRERKDDIRLLAADFLNTSPRPDVTLSEEAEAMLVCHDWPGNVRELKGVLEAASNLAESSVILPAHLNLPANTASITLPEVTAAGSKIEPLAEVERRHILAVYQALNNKTQAARKLGISLATLQRKLKAYRVK